MKVLCKNSRWKLLDGSLENRSYRITNCRRQNILVAKLSETKAGITISKKQGFLNDRKAHIKIFMKKDQFIFF